MKKLFKPKKKPTITVNNRLKEFGTEQNGNIEINVKKHHGDVKELSDTLWHEKYHAKHPKATEKVTYKKTHKAMQEMSYAEKQKLASQVRTKGIHYREGAIKRKLKMGRGNVEPGAYFKKMKEQAPKKKVIKKGLSSKRLSVMGLV